MAIHRDNRNKFSPKLSPPASESANLEHAERETETESSKIEFEDEWDKSSAENTDSKKQASRASSFGGLHVVAFESRQAATMRNLLRQSGARARVVPAMREVPLQHSAQNEFADELKHNRIDLSIWTTSVGVRLMSAHLDLAMPRELWTAQLVSSPFVARGARTVSALRALHISPTLVVPPPHTWRQTLQLLDARRDTLPLTGRRVVLQEPGTPNRVLERALTSRGAKLLRLPLYSWAMPSDVSVLLSTIHDIIEGLFDVVLFSNGTQVWHLFKLAYRNNSEDELKGALRQCVLASIGSSTTGALAEFDLVPHLESPSSQLRDFVSFVAAYAPSLAPRAL